MTDADKNITVYRGRHVCAETAPDGKGVDEPVFMKVGQNAGWYMTREDALELADDLLQAVNAVR